MIGPHTSITLCETSRGKSEQDVISREERLRSLVKIASCDITLDQPIEKGYEGPYDVILTMLSIESACQSEYDYLVFIKRLSRLLKPDGHLLLFSKLTTVTAQPIEYKVGTQCFYLYALTSDTVIQALEQTSFVNISTTHLSIAETLSGVQAADFVPIEAHPNDKNFYYMLFRAIKAS